MIRKYTQEIVQFTNEADTVSTPIFGDKTQLRSNLIMNAKDGREHTVKNFLERPVNLRNFEWKIADTQFKVLQTFNFPDDFLNIAMWREKFDGFYGLRADIKFRLQINAQPFQAGRLMLVWVPYASYKGHYGNHYSKGTEASLVSASGCPHVDIDISLSTECDITIPYCSPHSHFNLATGEGTWGTLYIINYSPLQDPAETGHIDCTAWINLQNVDLAFPTGATLITSATSPIVAQVGAEEKDAEEHRVLSKDIGKLADWLSPLNKVPVLSAITQPLTWCCDTASGVLSLLGYSKLQSQNVPEFVKIGVAHNMATYDGVDMSHPLSFGSTNSIELLPDMVGNNIDEMSLHHIVATPCYYRHFSWKATDLAGTELWSQKINPAYFYQSEKSTNTIYPSHLTYTSAIFQYWRGSIDITFKLVKTKFHSGRLRIYFQPGHVLDNTDGRKAYNYSQVVDIRSQTDIVFRVPYVATHPWLTVGELESTGGSNKYSTIGIVHVEVLNELVATSTVKSDIDVLVEVSAGPDFDLAAPCNPTMVPWRDITPPQTRQRRGVMDLVRNIGEAVAQVGQAEDIVAEQSDINKDQMGSVGLKDAWINEAACIGEKVTSVRQLIKRSHLCYNGVGYDPMLISPFRFSFGAESKSPATWDAVNISYIEYFRHIYGFWRGGLNYKICPKISGSNAIISFRVNRDMDAYVTDKLVLDGQSSDLLDKNNCLTKQIVPLSLEGVIDLHVPYYSAFHMLPVSDLAFSNVTDGLGLWPKGNIVVENIDTTNVKIFRNATDSFQFGYLVGPPQCVYYKAQ